MLLPPAELTLHPGLDGLEMLTAAYRDHAYALHTHETFVFGVVTSGVERFRVGRTRNIAPRGSIIAVNPQDPHDGEKGCEAGWSYRTCYPDVELVREIGAALGFKDLPLFPSPVMHAPDLARAFVRAHAAAKGDDALESETAMLSVLKQIVGRFAHVRKARHPSNTSGAATRLALYEDFIEDRLAGGIDLTALAGAAGVTRFQVIRDFNKAARMTPGQYIRDKRIRRASCLIRSATPLAEIALAVGFADQSHFTRIFKSVKGLTPSAYRSVLSG